MTDKNVSTTEPDLSRLLKKWYEKRRVVLFSTLAGMAVGVLFSVLLPARYTCVVKMIADTGQRDILPEISGISSLMGIRLQTAGREDDLDAALYPEIVASTLFLTEISSVAIGGISLAAFVPGFGGQRDGLSEQPSGSPREQKLFHMMRRSLHLTTDKKSGLITASVTLNDPAAAAVAADSLVAKLERYIIARRTRKAMADFSFIQERCDEARQHYYDARQEYARYADANLHTVKLAAEIERDRLFQQQQLAYSVYSQLAGQQETARLKVQEQTPVFTVIEPAQVPAFRSFPPRRMLVFGGLLTGLFLSLAIIAAGLVFTGKEG